MQSIQQQNPSLAWYVVVWRGLVKLDFISKFFAWLMEFLARVTEPMAVLATIYIIVVAGVPVVMVAPLYTFALMLIIGSPELLMVGAIKIACRELSEGNKKAWWLLASCCILLSLTALTVSDLFVWHWSAGAVSMLMGARCLAALGYTLARGVCTDQAGERVNVNPGSPVHTLLAEFTASIQDTVNQVNHTMLAEVNQIRQGLLAEVNRQHQQFVGEVHVTLKELGQHQLQLTTTVNGIQHGVQAELQAVVEVLGQQSQVALDTAVERLERANSRRMEAVYTRLEQVKVTLESNPALPAVPAGSSLLRLPTRNSSPMNPRPYAQAQQQPTNSSPMNPLMVPSQPGNPTGVNAEGEPEGLLEGTKVHQGHQFAVHYYHQYRVIPTLQTIMTAVTCSKTLASKARKRAETELQVSSTTEE